MAEIYFLFWLAQRRRKLYYQTSKGKASVYWTGIRTWNKSIWSPWNLTGPFSVLMMRYLHWTLERGYVSDPASNRFGVPLSYRWNRWPLLKGVQIFTFMWKKKPLLEGRSFLGFCFGSNRKVGRIYIVSVFFPMYVPWNTAALSWSSAKGLDDLEVGKVLSVLESHDVR